MNELIKRLQALTAPCREMDAEIHHWRLDGLGTGYRQDAPLYTASIDSAMTLVPEGDEFEITNLYGVARVTLGMNGGDDGPYYGEDPCGSIAIALCIAALKATQ